GQGRSGGGRLGLRAEPRRADLVRHVRTPTASADPREPRRRFSENGPPASARREERATSLFARRRNHACASWGLAGADAALRPPARVAPAGSRTRIPAHESRRAVLPGAGGGALGRGADEYAGGAGGRARPRGLPGRSGSALV